jgi:hypothetical protein
MTELHIDACNKLQGQLALLPDLQVVDWDYVYNATAETPALYFQISFDTPYNESTNDESVMSYMRSTIADIINVAVDRVIVSFRLTESDVTSRRLLQTNQATTADVWVYPSGAIDEPEMNNPTDLMIMFTESAGWRDQIMNSLALVMPLSSVTMGLTSESPNPPIPHDYTPPVYLIQIQHKEESSTGTVWIILLIGALVLVGLLVGCSAKSQLKNNEYVKQVQNADAESLVRLIQRTKIHM